MRYDVMRAMRRDAMRCCTPFRKTNLWDPSWRLSLFGVPLVVRLEGTNVNLGKKILDDSGLAIIAADDLADAAGKIVKAVKEAA